MKFPFMVRAIIATLWLQISVATAWLSLPALAPQIAMGTGIPALRIVEASGLLFVGAIIPTLAVSPIIARLGPIRIFQLGTLLAAAGVLVVEIGRPWAVILGAIIIGAGYGPGTPSASAVLACHTNPQMRSLVFSIKQSGVPIGGFLAGLTLPGIAIAIGWHWAISAVAMFCVLSALWIGMWRRELDRDLIDPEIRIQPRELIRSLHLLPTLRLHPDLPRITFHSFAAASFQSGIVAILTTFLVQDGGITGLQAGLIFSLTNIAGAIGRIGFGLLADRIISPQALLAALPLPALASILTLVIFGSALPFFAIMLLGILFGLTGAGWNGVLIGEIASLAPSGAVSRVSASSLPFMFAGYLVGPVITGGLVELFNSYLLGVLPTGVMMLWCSCWYLIKCHLITIHTSTSESPT